MDIGYLKNVVEGALLAAGAPLNLNQLNALFPDEEKPGHGALKEALAALDAELEGRAVELTEVGSGYRIQIRTRFMPIISNLWTEKPPRYSRALLETLAIIAYRQPITRGDIEQIRGVSLSANILRTLQERDWIKVVGHRDVPGRPELLGTTRSFLDYFNLKSLDELPTLAEIKDIDNLEPELELIHPAAGSNVDEHPDEVQDDSTQDPEPEENEQQAGASQDSSGERRQSDEGQSDPAADEEEDPQRRQPSDRRAPDTDATASTPEAQEASHPAGHPRSG
ncbi:MAG: SMC-Scp complex subunit ScpB [Wenzhouxiangella sp.]